MIDVKQAIRTARDYVRMIYDTDEFPLTNLLLEEVEPSEDGQYWYITYGFDVPTQPARAARGQASLWDGESYSTRMYKTIMVRTDDGVAEAMKIHEV
jgi:hypothetical protein